MLLDKTLPMLHQAGLSYGFWELAFQAASHIYNRMPLRRLKWHLPFESWTFTVPDISHLRVFGCKAYVHMQKDDRKKLDAHSMVMTFVGYENDAGGYCFWNRTARRLVVSSDVTFDETSFPHKPEATSQPTLQVNISYDVADLLPPVDLATPAEDQAPPVEPEPFDDEDEEPLAPKASFSLPPSSHPSRLDTPLPGPTPAPTTPIRPPLGRCSQAPSPSPDSSSGDAPSNAPGTTTPPPLPPLRVEPIPWHTQGPFNPASHFYVPPPASPPILPQPDNPFLDPEPEPEDPGRPVHQGARTHPHRETDNTYGSLHPSLIDRAVTKKGDFHPPQPSNQALIEAGYHRDPLTLKEALASSHKDEWLAACMYEINALHHTNTWELVDLPKGRKQVKNKWVFKLKENGTYRAHLVAKGFTQVHGIDYDETFSPVARYDSVRLILVLAAKEDWELHGMDVKSAFLNGVLDEEIYMEQPKGFAEAGLEDKVCRLIKAIYGLKQASTLR